MAKASLADFADLLNQQIQSRQILSNELVKAEALANVSVCTSFLDSPLQVLHNYLLALNDLIESARTVNDENLDSLLKTRFSYTNNRF